MLRSICFFSDSFRASSVRNRSLLLHFRHMHEKAEGAMFNYNNSLVVESLFFFPVVRESRGLTLALCARKLHVASLPITARTLTTETSLQYWLKRLLSWSEGVARAHHHGTHSCEGIRTGLALRHASYGQISVSIHCMINVESLPARTSRWELLRCPVVPTAERIVELPLVKVEVFNGNVVNQLEAPFIFAPGRLTSVALGSSSRRATTAWCFLVILWYWQSFSGRSWVVHCSLVLCCLDCWYV